MSTTEIIEIIKNAYSINDVCLKVYGYTNGSSTNKINTIISNNNIDVSHFKTKNKNRKWEKIEKICPVCKSTFYINENSKKITCSVGCSNTYFRSNKPQDVKDKISQSLKKYIRVIKKTQSTFRIQNIEFVFFVEKNLKERDCLIILYLGRNYVVMIVPKKVQVKNYLNRLEVV